MVFRRDGQITEAAYLADDLALPVVGQVYSIHWLDALKRQDLLSE
jgi:hypothetical protein